jgi:hypothetical protein
MNGTGDRADFASDGRPRNPFATRYTRPGAIPPLDTGGRPLDLESLAKALSAAGAAALQGAHGHGKTTLLVALADTLAAAGRRVRVLRMRGVREAWEAVVALAVEPAETAVFVDGWERLGVGGRALAALARHRRGPLLVTAHAPVGLPVLRHCTTSVAMLRAIVARLPDHGGLIDDDDVARAFHRHGGDLRESLADLYDRVEGRRAAGPKARPA